MLLESEAFLTELTRMFQKSRDSGSLVITMKRWDGHEKPKPRDLEKKPPKNKKLKKKLEKLQSIAPAQTKEYKCLLRAVLGSRKISTVVTPQEAMKFQASYSILLRGNIDGLRKKEKKKAAAAN
ncbi:signal recognition particle 14 kDa protein [Galendromus occidentalis]|uniref:Signal recognition particle 14 kDa protein n=1 Tax=Galendromus occidentalis TaxID=34638 RepID=A0AAJ6QN18_9ACAR|nr:signal recognition particle 14 kDa protein [Galendromus occidentalis]